jgi:mRNA-degrading endonuclease RelE of RelBE toxin-antitoxin system
VLLVGDDPARVLQEVEASVERLLESRDLYELQRLVWALLTSPYRGLGVLLARSVLPIVDEEYVPGLFDGILDARAKLNLTGEDEFSDWMDEHALRKSHQHETAAAQEAQDKLAAKMEELRGVKEETARLERERDLQNRQERRESERLKTAPGPEAEAVARNRELNTKIERLSALLREGGKEKLGLRRKLEETTRENEALKSGSGTPEPKQAEEDDDFEVPGNQPVRLLEFPEGFADTLAGFQRHAARAAMSRLGQLASGEPSAFQAIKQLKAYHGVLRVRVAGEYRLLFCLLPDRVRVVDLIRRADLDRRIDRLKASGLPPIG